MSCPTKCNNLYFISTRTARYFVNVFIGSFLDHTQCSHDYWHGSSFNVSRFLNFHFQVFEFTNFIIFFDWFTICWHCHNNYCPVGWCCRIHRLQLLDKCPGYDTKQSDSEFPVMLELWGMQRTPSLPLLTGPLWPGMVAPDRGLYMG